MKKSIYLAVSVIMVLTMILTACAPAATPTAAPAQPTSAPAAAEPTSAPAAAEPTQAPAAVEPTKAPAAEAPKNPGLQGDAAKVAMQFFSQEDMDKEISLMDKPALNPNDPIYLQYLEDTNIDTAKYKKDGPYTICFSNAGVGNPWRVVGWTDMQEEVKLHPEIKEFIAVDAQSKDEKQIADIADLVAGGKCDILIVSPNTTAALTPAVEAACQKLPVIEFDRYTQSECAVVKERSIGGYAYGAAGANFIIDNLPNGGNVLALRILPGVDVLEQRWGAARQIFEKAGNINIIGVEFGMGDNAKVKTIVTDYLDRYGKIDAVWMDAGATAVAALEGFADAGQPYPIISGEDQQDFLKYWKDNNLKAIAPVFATYMWRTAILASLKVLKGETVPARWYLPQPSVTQENLDKFYNPKMPPLHYAMCGCEDMPTYPEAWGGTK